MSLREATAADVPLIQGIARATWPISYAAMISPAQITYMLHLMYSTSALEDQLGPKGHRFLLAEQDGEVVGFAGFEHSYRGTKRTRLHKLYALPQLQGAGVGSELLQAVATAAGKAGNTALELNVNKQNRAKSFYLRHGFVVERDEVLDIGDGYVMDDHVMVKSLQG
ncbi:MAG: GNAT family N-acetyltransferase [Flavobacteriales bacterium]|nr:GNAT family N-acetyltransferase [Flavobacteriales bacterium]